MNNQNPHAPEPSRSNPAIRKQPVRDLTANECSRLLVHAHERPPMRGKAYLLRSGRPPEVYFTPDEIKKIEAWIEAEEAAPENPMRAVGRKKMKCRSAR